MDGRSLKLFRDVSFPDEAAQLTTTLFSQYNTVFINKFTEHLSVLFVFYSPHQSHPCDRIYRICLRQIRPDPNKKKFGIRSCNWKATKFCWFLSYSDNVNIKFLYSAMNA
jgi:hypothetical protein